ncbi:MAG: flavodoxin [Clostridia bacterium]|nr:flavodoxin [Clostridia bacterium]
MSEILFVNACVRGDASRTLALARKFLDACVARHPGDVVVERNLMEDRLQPWYPETLAESAALEKAGRFDQPMFEAARQFVSADKIVIAAPFWELSFPAILKIYLERVSIVGLTFGYDANGSSVGYCKAEKLLFVTTRGGHYSTPATAWMEMGAGQLRGLCTMYGIPEFRCLCAEGLDDVRNDAAALLRSADDEAVRLATTF